MQKSDWKGATPAPKTGGNCVLFASGVVGCRILLLAGFQDPLYKSQVPKQQQDTSTLQTSFDIFLHVWHVPAAHVCMCLCVCCCASDPVCLPAACVCVCVSSVCVSSASKLKELTRLQEICICGGVEYKKPAHKYPAAAETVPAFLLKRVFHLGNTIILEHFGCM